jgi:hypothetical protein
MVISLAVVTTVANMDNRLRKMIPKQMRRDKFQICPTRDVNNRLEAFLNAGSQTVEQVVVGEVAMDLGVTVIIPRGRRRPYRPALAGEGNSVSPANQE